MYLMKYTLCNKQYFEKVKTVFNIILSSYRKHVKDPNAILACKRFSEPGKELTSMQTLQPQIN